MPLYFPKVIITLAWLLSCINLYFNRNKTILCLNHQINPPVLLTRTIIIFYAKFLPYTDFSGRHMLIKYLLEKQLQIHTSLSMAAPGIKQLTDDPANFSLAAVCMEQCKQIESLPILLLKQIFPLNTRHSLK